jgi:hypothetical protein
MVGGWIGSQGWPLLLLALAGLVSGRRLRVLTPVIVLLACAAGMNVAMTLSDTIGIASPSRFTLGFLWLCVPPALLATGRAWSGRRSWRIALLLFLGATTTLGWSRWIRQEWGGLPIGEEEKIAFEAFANLVRREKYFIVVENGDAFPLVNGLRLYCSWQRVAFLPDFHEATPAQGMFLYFHQPGRWLSERKVTHVSGHDVAFLHRMPPADGGRPRAGADRPDAASTLAIVGKK